MRVLPTVSLLALLFAIGAADAQSAAPSEGAPPKSASTATEPVKSLQEQTDAWFKDCKQGWDAGTHMSRKDYERTCLRMAQERIKFMRDWEKNGGDRAKAK